MRQYDKDYMKAAMLNQEETFRQQVSELHRLYRVQKLLMRGAAELQAPCRGRPPATAMLGLELPVASADGDEEGNVELTLATGGGRGAGRNEADISGSAGPSGASLTSSASTESGPGSGGGNLDIRDWGLWYSRPDEEGPRPLAVAVRQGRGDHRHHPSWHMHHWSVRLNMT